MTMHLCGPALTTTGKRKGKIKFRNAAEAQRARDLDQSWKQLKADWGVQAETRRRVRAMRAEPLAYSLTAPPGRETQRIESRDTGHTGAVRSRDIPQYTGDHVMGVTVLHKSCLQPVFSKQDAVDAAKMRR